MSAPTLTITEGTTYGFETTWTSNDEARTPVDITGCTAQFAITPASSRRRLVDCTTENGGITLDGPTGHLAVRIAPEMTAGSYSSAWQGARYELRVTFPSGDVYSLLRGEVELIQGVIDD